MHSKISSCDTVEGAMLAHFICKSHDGSANNELAACAQWNRQNSCRTAANETPAATAMMIVHGQQTTVHSRLYEDDGRRWRRTRPADVMVSKCVSNHVPVADVGTAGIGGHRSRTQVIRMIATDDSFFFFLSRRGRRCSCWRAPRQPQHLLDSNPG